MTVLEIRTRKITVYKLKEDGTLGDVVESWTSGTTAHELKLGAGKYAFKETVNPEGYKAVTTNVKFTVEEDGSVTLDTATEEWKYWSKR